MSGKPRDTTRRDCTHGGMHVHGTTQAYKADRCRCDDCRGSEAAAARARYRLAAYGRWQRRVPVEQVRCRVEALVWLGWSVPKIAGRSGLYEVALRRFLWDDKLVYVTPRNARKLFVAFDAMSGSLPPERTHAERQVASRMRNLARSRGYRPPLALDVDAGPMAAAGPVLDEVAIERAMRGDPVPLTRDERAEAWRRLEARGLSARQIGTLLGESARNVQRRRTAA